MQETKCVFPERVSDMRVKMAEITLRAVEKTAGDCESMSDELLSLITARILSLSIDLSPLILLPLLLLLLLLMMMMLVAFVAASLYGSSKLTDRVTSV